MAEIAERLWGSADGRSRSDRDDRREFGGGHYGGNDDFSIDNILAVMEARDNCKIPKDIHKEISAAASKLKSKLEHLTKVMDRQKRLQAAAVRGERGRGRGGGPEGWCILNQCLYRCHGGVHHDPPRLYCRGFPDIPEPGRR